MRQLKNSELILFLIFITLLIYSEVPSNDFVWDDFWFVVNNPCIRQIKYLPDLFVKSFKFTAPIGSAFEVYYRPFFVLSFIADYHIFKLNPFFYHLHNIFLHVFNSVLVYFLILILTKRSLLSFLSALFFSLHPIHVDAVAPIFNRMDLLASLFILASLIIFIKASDVNRHKFRSLYYCFALLLFVCGLLSKEFAFILPALYLIYDFYFLADLNAKNIFKRGFFYLLCFIILALYFCIRFYVLGADFAGYYNSGRFTNFYYPAYKFWQVTIVIQSIALYLKLLIIPLRLSAVYLVKIKPLWHIEIIGTAFFLFMIFLMLFRLKDNRRDISYMILWFFITIFPVSNIIPFGGRISEHYAYLSSLSFCFILSLMFTNLLENKNMAPGDYMRKKIIILCIFLVAFFYGYRTMLRNYDWKHEFVLWSKETKLNPHYALAHTNLGSSYLKQGLCDKALSEFDTVILLEPNQSFGYLLKGFALAKKGLYEQGIRFMEIALSIDPNNQDIYNNLGNTYFSLQKFDSAIKYYEKAIQLNPVDVMANYNLGLAYYYENNLEDALKQFKRVEGLDSNYAPAYYGMGLVYQKQGNKDLAKNMFVKCLRLNPFFQQAVDMIVETRRDSRYGMQ